MQNDSKEREQVNRLGRPSIEMLDKEIARRERTDAYKRLLFISLMSIVTAAAVIILVTNLWVPVLRIEGSSMNPLLEMDEIVLAITGDNPERNDIIAFYHDDKLYIKRVVAISGDWINIDADGVVSVNNIILNEPYVTELALGSCNIEFPYMVHSGTVFVLGDNRSTAIDSRNSGFGTVSRERIVGKIIFRVWPLSRFGSVS